MSEQNLSIPQIISKFFTNYKLDTPKRVKIIDLFIVYAITTALIQFAYCVIVGTFPFNSFLAGFFTCIGFVVLTGL